MELKKLFNNIKLEYENILEYATYSIRIAGNNEKFTNSFIEILRPHFFDTKKNNKIILSFSLIISSDVIKNIINVIRSVKYSDHISVFCSTESGTQRLRKFDFKDILIFESEKTNVFLVFDKEKNSYYCVCGGDYIYSPTWYKDVFVFFEHIIHKRLNALGSVLIHASAVTNKRGKCFLISGNKRAGKTTMLFDFIKNFDFCPISVDKTHVFIKDNDIIAYGFPSRLRVLSGTLSKYSPFFDDIIPNEYLNVSKEILWKGESKGKVNISISLLEKFCRKKFVLNDKISSFIFPNISFGNLSTVEILQKHDIADFLKENIFTPNNPEEEWWSLEGKEQEIFMIENRKQLLTKVKELISFKLIAEGSLIEPINKILNNTKALI